MKEYYSLPLDLGKITKGEEIQKCNMHQSIAQRIHMVLVTRQKEFRYDEEFGSPIWDNDFENVPNINLWKDKMGKSIAEGLLKNEKRLERTSVRIEITQEEFSHEEKADVKRIKRRLDISVDGFIVQTNEPFYYKESIYVSPVWLD